MLKNLYERSAAKATALKDRIRNDPFRIVRFQLMGLYLLAGVVIFMLFGWGVGSIALESVFETTIYETGSSVEEAVTEYQEGALKRRILSIVLFVIATYFLTEFALRPVKRAAELQKHFIAIVSHELRTPLTVMKNMSEVALRNPGNLTREKAVGIIESNLEETNRLSSTVQFLLTFSLLKSRKDVPDAQDIALAALIEQVASAATPYASERDVRLETVLDEQVATRGNQVALEGMLLNLVRNAIQHTPEGSVVTITADRNLAGKPRLSVQDAGVGIAKEDLPYIFEPFYRGRNPDSSGFGLGLSIVRQVAELHRALLEVKTGQGSVFTVTFAS